MTFNSERWIAQVLANILDQEFSDFRVLVVDDCSTDSTVDILETFAADPRVKLVVNHLNRGLIGNWTYTLSLLEEALDGVDYLWIAQHDDHYGPQYLRTLVSTLDRDPTLAAVQMVPLTESCSSAPHVYYWSPRHTPNLFGKVAADARSRPFQPHTLNTLINGLIRASVAGSALGMNSRIAGELITHENLLVLSLLHHGGVALEHGEEYSVFVGDTVSTLYPNLDFNVRRASILASAKDHWRLLRALSSGQAPRRALSAWLVCESFLRGERRFPRVKRTLQRLGMRLKGERLEREVRKIYPLRPRWMYLNDYVALWYRSNLLIHRVKSRLWRAVPDVVGRPLLLLSSSGPRTFNQRLRHQMYRDRGHTRKVLTDKILAKRYIENRVGAKHIPRTLAILRESTHLCLGDLPRNFVAKPSHLSGGTVIVSDTAPRGGVLPPTVFGRCQLHPDDVDLDSLRNYFARCLATTYMNGARSDEGYRDLEPGVIIEELLSGADGLPCDVKLFMVRGKCRLVRVMTPISGQVSEKAIDDFLPDWSHVDAAFVEPGKVFPHAIHRPSRPIQFDEMLRAAEALSAGLEFARVDFLVAGSEFWIGEITCCPTGGRGYWLPNLVDHYLGDCWSRADA